ncbi:hypothetical protein [Alloactinosynnema sp. L-07]|nr:hypothetical protein [Alloactinosynnema sp. L-07]
MGNLRSLVFHEATANRSVAHEPEVIPGLLQTEPYFRALFADFGMSSEEMDAFAAVRMERQLVMFRNNPAKFTFLCTSVLCAWRSVTTGS